MKQKTIINQQAIIRRNKMAIYKTSENAKDERLATNWYQNDYTQCMEAVKKVCLQYGYDLIHQDDNYGEFIFKRSKDTLDVKIISMTRRETAIDFVINSNLVLDFGRSKNVIQDLYERLKRELRFFKR